ncbi:dipeptidyl aminopeptidase 3, putative [Hepatocystis sp. ex Piliocolobus tephrosceles]|nr:dipeptidyl aminopeptidase 3, putative [Hepatocystis sp. ex Piliocolobus tephrosceles]
MVVIYFFFLFFFFFKYVNCDIPVHCLSRHVIGTWEINIGLLKRTNMVDTDYDYNCGYKRPDHEDYHENLNPEILKEKFERKKKMFLVFNNDRTVNVIVNNKKSYDYGGYWRIIYDEGLYMELYNIKKKTKEIYFSFFKFKKIENMSYSYCYNFIMGMTNIYQLKKWSTGQFPFSNKKIDEDIYSSVNRKEFNNDREINFNEQGKMTKGNSNTYYNTSEKKKKYKNRGFLFYYNKKWNSFFNCKNDDNYFKTNERFNSLKGFVSLKRKMCKPIEYTTSTIMLGQPILNNYYIQNDKKKRRFNLSKKLIKFATIIDSYVDNSINFDELNLNRYCWSGHKINVPTNNPTNIIPVSGIHPSKTNKTLTHDKNDNIVNMENVKSKLATVNATIQVNEKIIPKKSDYVKTYRNSYNIGNGKITYNNVESANINNTIKHTYINKIKSNDNKKKLKQNSLVDKYSDKIVKLKEFDWTNENDVKKRLNSNTYVKIIDEPINQKSCGSCYANSAIIIINSRLRIKYHYIKNIDFLLYGKDQLVLCDMFNQGCDGGYIYISLKYAYENYLYTNSCFSKYLYEHMSGDSTNDNAVCEYFDTFSIFLSKKQKSDINGINTVGGMSKSFRSHIPNISSQMKKKNNTLYDNYVLVTKQMNEKKKVDLKKINICDTKIKIRQFFYLDIQKEEDIKKYLYYNGPIAAAIEPPITFTKYKHGILKGSYIKMYDGDESDAYIWNKVDHAVVIVGWGEDTPSNLINREKEHGHIYDKHITEHLAKHMSKNMSKDMSKKRDNDKNKNDNNSNSNTDDNPNVIKYWKVLNSWGKNWGSHGYFYMIRNQNSFNITSYLLTCDVNMFIKMGADGYGGIGLHNSGYVGRDYDSSDYDISDYDINDYDINDYDSS